MLGGEEVEQNLEILSTLKKNKWGEVHSHLVYLLIQLLHKYSFV